MATIVHSTNWSITAGTTLSVAIPAAAAGNKLIVTSAGESIITAKITNTSGAAFTKRTTYGGGDYDVSVSDFVAVGGETAVFLTLNGAGRNGGTIIEVSGSLTFTSATNNGVGPGTVDASKDWQTAVTASSTISSNSLVIATCAHKSGATVGAPTQFGPMGKIQGSGVVGATVAWATAVADITAARSYPENLATGAYRATFGLPVPVSVTNMFVAQAVYTDTSGAATVTQANPIAGENTLPGTAYANWYGSTSTTATIAGYCDKTSYNPGDTVNFKVDSASATFRVEVYRLGWYGGEWAGARNAVGYQTYITGTPTAQSAPTVDGTLGSASCAWTTNATWTVPSNAAPGVYQVLFRRTDTGHTGDYWIGVFIVKASSNTGKVAVILGDSTWQAYNDWGSTTNSTAGRNLYYISTSVNNNATRAYGVSFDRPYRTWVDNSNTWLFDSELSYVMALEQFGYNAAYYSCIDMENNTTLLNSASLVMPIGHHEYWSQGMYDCLTNARGAGVNMHFVSSNTALWHTRFAAADTTKRTMICYKDSLTVDVTAGWTGTGRDPVSYTGTWRDARTSTPNNTDIRRENALTGQLFGSNASITQQLKVPFASKTIPIWRNSAAVQALAGGTSYTTSQATLGNEMDWADGSTGQPTNLTAAIAPTTMTMANQGVNANGSIYTLSTPTSATVGPTLYLYSSGALVYNTGSWRGWWGISRWYSGAYNSANTLDLDLQNAFLSIMYDLGAAPATLNKAITSDTAPVNPSTGAPGPGNSAVATAYGLASGGSTQTGAVTFPVVVTLGTVGNSTQAATVGFNIGINLGVTGQKTAAAAVAFPVTTGVAVTGQKTTAGTVAFPVNASLTVTGQDTLASVVAFPVTCALTIAGQGTLSAAVPFPVGATLTVTGQKTSPANTAYPVTTSLSLAGQGTPSGSVPFPISTGLTAASAGNQNGTITYSISTTLNLAGQDTTTGTTQWPIGSSLNLSGQDTVSGTSAWPVTTTLATVGQKTSPALLPFTVSSTFTTTGQGTTSSPVAFPVSAGLSVASTGQSGTVAWSVASGLTVAGQHAASGAAAWPVAAGLQIVGTSPSSAFMAFPVTTSLDLSGLRVTPGTVPLPILTGFDIRITSTTRNVSITVTTTPTRRFTVTTAAGPSVTTGAGRFTVTTGADH